MKLSLLGVLALVAPVCPAVEHQDTLQRTFQLGSGARQLIVETIQGHIRVQGDSGSDVRATVRERYSAETEEALAAGRERVKLPVASA